MWCQRGQGSDHHIIAIVADLSGNVFLCWDHDLGFGLVVRVR
jgi:hypothetical protein